MNTTNMHRKSLTFRISGNMVHLKPDIGRSHMELRIEGLTDDALVLDYSSTRTMSQDIEAFERLFGRLEQIQPESWGNSKGVMSRSEKRLMRLAILLVGISVLTCLVFLLIQLFK